MIKKIVFITLIVLACVAAWIYLHGNRPLSRNEGAAISSLKNFYNTAMAFFTTTDATLVTSDGAPEFVPDPDLNITGGPMKWDGTNVTFTNPLYLNIKILQFFLYHYRIPFL